MTVLTKLAMYNVSKFDFLKCYWQRPLTDRAKEVSAFAVDDNFYQYKVMLFGLKNTSAIFQRMMRFLLNDLRGCGLYIDYVIKNSTTWEEHLKICAP